MKTEQRAQVLSQVAERIALLNEFRTDDFQDEVVRIVNDAREHWREGGGELPRIGSDPLFDALMRMVEVADSSPIAVRDACAAAFRQAEDARAAR
ncbi:MAG TPA: hypothetical protein VFC31_10860 [Candidatus Limnocylindria bacterium]|nr:hypothetical protein [Candidatus Limnocylindria bacterium]